MTTDELQAAAERLRTATDSTQMLPHGHEYIRNGWRRGIDERLLADAYLAEHPADDGEAVDEPWLLSVGFTGGHQYKRSNGFTFMEFDCGESCIAVSEPIDGQEEWNVGGERVPHVLMPETRGDARRLFAKAGITLKDQ